MSDIKAKLAIGEGQNIQAAGDFIHVRSCTGFFHLEITTNNNGNINVSTFEADTGDQFKPLGGFVSLRVMNDKLNAPLDIELVIGSGEFSRGSTAISTIQSILNPIEVKPREVNGYFYHNFAGKFINNIDFIAIVLPASNSNGIVVEAAYLGSSNVTKHMVLAADFSLITSTALPYGVPISSTRAGGVLLSPIVIHAGLGLYLVKDKAGRNEVTYADIKWRYL